VNMSAQNLVPNGSFEEGVECPSFVANLDAQCSNWFGSVIDELNFTPTPDWFHECSEFESLAPPNVAFGYKEPFEGSGYAGIVTYSLNDPNYREIMGVELEDFLTIGQSYLISFYISRLSESGLNFASNNMGFMFTTYPTFDIASFPTNEAIFSVDTAISDTTNWIEVSVEVAVDSAYKFLHIGNFFDDDNTDTLKFSPNAIVAYYIIDNVSLTSTLSIESEAQTSSFKVYPNPIDDFFQIERNESDQIVALQVIDMNGKVVINLLNPSILDSINVSFLPNGIYILSLLTNKTKYNEKIIKI
jgi:hypothetical protein